MTLAIGETTRLIAFPKGATLKDYRRPIKAPPIEMFLIRHKVAHFL